MNISTQFLDEGQPALTAKQIAESADSTNKPVKPYFCSSISGKFHCKWHLEYRSAPRRYISGGIVPKLIDFLPHSQFFARLSTHGAYSDYVGAVPIYLIDGEQAEQAGLLGAGLALTNSFLNHRRG